MPARQLHLLEPNRPLLARVGREFFRAVPRQPGVYIMTGKSERVLYIGQSGNLRARLGSYKNARLDCAPRKMVRLVHLVESITYETCPSPEAAIVRESELLLLHRPKFNSMGVFPKKPKYIQLGQQPTSLTLSFRNDDATQGKCYGPFKGDVLAGFAALCRTLWTVVYRPVTLGEFPLRLLTQGSPREMVFRFAEAKTESAALIQALRQYLAGASAELLTVLEASLPSPNLLSPFQCALHTQDLETLKEFYDRAGGKKNGPEIVNLEPVSYTVSVNFNQQPCRAETRCCSWSF